MVEVGPKRSMPGADGAGATEDAEFDQRVDRQVGTLARELMAPGDVTSRQVGPVDQVGGEPLRGAALAGLLHRLAQALLEGDEILDLPLRLRGGSGDAFGEEADPPVPASMSLCQLYSDLLDTLAARRKEP